MSEDRQARDVAFIRALAGLLRENDLTEVQVKRDYAEEGSLKVRLARQLQAPQAVTMSAAPAQHAPAPPPRIEERAAEPVEDLALLPGAVTSPMVGSVYLAPEPGAPAFVAVGDVVAEGQTLLIIEAMKTMNQIPAPRAGRIARIVVENGAPVEFGAPLMVIE